MSRTDERPATVSDRSRRAFARRSRARRWLRVRPLAVVAGVLLLVVGAGWVVLASPVLVARSVEVQVVARGTDHLDPATIRRLAAVPLGRPMARLDTAAVGERVRQLPGVAAVRVSRSWPSTVVVTVTARTPVAAVRSGAAYALVDREAVPFQQVSAVPAGLPLVAAGQADGAAALKAAVDVVIALPPALRTRVTGVTAPTAEDVTFTLGSGRTVVWGGVARSARKAVVLAALLKYPAKVYDVSAPDAPTTRGRP